MNDVKIMTQNVCYGGGTFNFLDMWKNMKASNIPERAAAIAKQIKTHLPDFVVLQEAVIWRQSNKIEHDFVAEILKHLTHRKWRYQVVSAVTNADWILPMFSKSVFSTMQMTDQDVILARVAKGARFRIANPLHGNFQSQFQINLQIQNLNFNRGWASIDARLGKRGPIFRLITTHLEVLDKSVQQKQAVELMRHPTTSRLDMSLILAGDFNSDAQTAGVSYQLLTHSEFKDAWNVVQRDRAGPTAAQDADLRNKESKLISRIDLVLYRGATLHATNIFRINAAKSDKTPSGLWPSDHAGIVATIQLA